MIYLICFGIAVFASLWGPICGMGGGILIKPVLDATGVMPIATITMLSGFTVVAMAVWNMTRTFIKKESVVELRRTTWLAIGAAVGGLLGKQLFNMVAGLFADRNTAGGVQAALMFLMTLATLLYTLNREKIRSKSIDSSLACLVIGLGMGTLAAFLGIGGGPFNVAILFYFFSMPPKKAAQNSLYVIIFSQSFSIGKTLIESGMPEVDPWILIGMIVSAILGAEIGRRLNKKLNNAQTARCLECVMILVLCINVYNIIKYIC